MVISSNILLRVSVVISDRFLANVCMCSQAFKKAPDDPKPKFPTVSNLSFCCEIKVQDNSHAFTGQSELNFVIKQYFV